ncbi:GTP pyrophosphokinase [Aliivibrio sp. 1S165]|uniref:GTP pyrophosphokinase n=1 Tax=unclassified Aliivibrio TaxID=2645654 RepID=UPI00080DDA61|nr:MULTISPECIES: GTP pyrophosphokinase [unclassified Aliivibrio]OCH14606.1 GTP pyrophosphokinase [Aliivibrio sp. 1S165]OCH31896.1 GTP pyrophosphokinase [Aliivibrio sp. 1S175]
MEEKHVKWLDDALKTHSRLTESVVTVFENLLKAKNIDFLAVTGRTKDKKSVLEKIERKGYKRPEVQMTDLSGVRVILYFESDVDKVSELISESFGVDFENSMDKSKVLSKDQIGYRSVHFVCTLGSKRAILPEYSNLTDLKFEVQVRTVLQHAWAELAHDSNYKFSGTLPPEIERKLYLYAGMLEVADKGFDELSSQIDAYKDSVDKKSKSGDLSINIDSISVKKFFDSWVKESGIEIDSQPKNINDLVRELKEFKVHTLSDLKDIIPINYEKVFIEIGEQSNILGIIRDWMLISDWKRFLESVQISWCVDEDSLPILRRFVVGEDYNEMLNKLDSVGSLELEGYGEDAG